MFLGHFGLAYAAKRAEPRLPLWVLFAASQLVDIGWMLFILLGIERVRISPGITQANALEFVDYPYTHSLLGSMLWAMAAAGVIWIAFRKKKRSHVPAIITGGLVFSHFWLDVIVHRPDLSIAGEGTPHLGLELWNNIPLTLTIELGMLSLGLLMYYRGTQSILKGGRFGHVLFMVILSALWLPSVFGSVPPSVMAVAITGLVTMPLILLTAHWLDKKRATC